MLFHTEKIGLRLSFGCRLYLLTAFKVDSKKSKESLPFVQLTYYTDIYLFKQIYRI